MRVNKDKFKEDFVNKLVSKRGKKIDEANLLDKYYALASLTRDYIGEYWVKTNKKYIQDNKKQIYYFSMEFLIGKLLISNLLSLGIKEICEEGLKELGLDLNQIAEIEKEPGLGNGGLGRLAACFSDSMATLGIPGYGIGIRYKYGLFQQKIIDGYQKEFPDQWLKYENAWEIKRPSESVEVKFGGNVRITQEDNRLKFIHEKYESILAVPYDVPIVGYKNNIVNTLRLLSAEVIDKEFDYYHFNKGEYTKAFEDKLNTEAISYVLYPEDSYEKGRILRLKQEYFLVSSGVQNIIKTYKKSGKPLKDFYKHVSIHINDTHPALAIPEVMRILIDEEGFGWDEAWKITKHTISYTNHTIMAEALEKWNVDMVKNILPRIFMIIEEINERFCRELWNTKYHGDFNKISEMAIIADNQIKMAHLAIVGSHSINGVAKLHTEILKRKELKEFYNIYPEKFNNKTNGISHRRWLLKCNPKLASLISEYIGPKWIDSPEDLINLIEFKSNPYFKQRINEIKQYNKNKFAEMVKEKYSIDINPNSIFDIQAKRIHEYKRQVLNVLHIMHIYNKLIENPNLDIYPRTFIFAGKAAPGYYIAKETIKLINSLGEKINNDNRIKDKLKVVFVEDYNVTLAELLIPAADISEQISTTTKEASGTGNMKFMMNGAITIATLDGANIEIANEVGEENIIIFGLKAKEVLELYNNKTHKSIDLYNEDGNLKKIMDELINGFLPVSKEAFKGIYDSLLKDNDKYLVLKDFNDYVRAQEKIDKLYRNNSKWLEMSITNIAYSGKFSSDKTIVEYAKEIWGTL
ncbi:glycogen/starch/alpha-glucan phosphorylase [Oceanirhabdus sp. W0125-5]|uniref:glycogen/starch/alpha-glucan phosphorylase n=1 Tax=Oceanirhabdus sp. W0125-5 TaxID=2999116 RepID=UPI0022F33D17|nr:glycogen/starch/alpha-glucan phosphorylase [Oceanirhabdus sp. W0125-5]WBW97146.1 glycogen/starch/alpha-glucan phosphorylase [Oceanirhabdus sp. W0125-5]